jgi:hypothetical protein
MFHLGFRARASALGGLWCCASWLTLPIVTRCGWGFLLERSRMAFLSRAWTPHVLARARLRLVSFLVRMWRLKACLRLISPVPVSLNRFLAPDLVFILGMASSLVVDRCRSGLDPNRNWFSVDVRQPDGSPLHRYFFFFGIRNMIMRLPSSLGMLSTMPISSRSWANFSSRISPALLEDDAAATEEHEGLHLVALFQEAPGVLQLEVHVVLVRVGPKRISFISATACLALISFCFFLRS